jgi:hypothetical protein
MSYEETEKKVLCSLESIVSVRKHINADRLYVARVLGYDVIINLEAFGNPASLESLVGAKGLMFFVDAVIPSTLSNGPHSFHFSYLSDSHMGKRVRTIKLRGEFSQGLFFSLSTAKELFPEIKFDEIPAGTNLTLETGTVKYFAKEDVECPYLGKLTSSKSCREELKARLMDVFPAQIPKTDQPHLQKQTALLENAGGRPFVVTLKVDGQSGTFFYDPETKEAGMCSRNYRLLTDESGKNPTNPQFLYVQEKYHILEGLARLGRPIAIQGEIYGDAINGNRLQMKGWHFVVFDVYEWDPVPVEETSEGKRYRGKYLPHTEVIRICKELEIPCVPVLRECGTLTELPQSIDDWLNMASGLTWDALSPKKGLLAEGMVVKTTDDKYPYISCKVISRPYLAKHGL